MGYEDRNFLDNKFKCEQCGKIVERKSGNQKYCKDCAYKRELESKNKSSRKWRKNNPEKFSESKRNWKKNNLEIVKESARKTKAKYLKKRKECITKFDKLFGEEKLVLEKRVLKLLEICELLILDKQISLKQLKENKHYTNGEDKNG